MTESTANINVTANDHLTVDNTVDYQSGHLLEKAKAALHNLEQYIEMLQVEKSAYDAANRHPVLLVDLTLNAAHALEKFLDLNQTKMTVALLAKDELLKEVTSAQLEWEASDAFKADLELARKLNNSNNVSSHNTI